MTSLVEKAVLVMGGGTDGPPESSDELAIGNGRVTAMLWPRTHIAGGPHDNLYKGDWLVYAKVTGGLCKFAGLGDVTH